MDRSAAQASGSGHYCEMTYLVTHDMNQTAMGTAAIGCTGGGIARLVELQRS